MSRANRKRLTLSALGVLLLPAVQGSCSTKDADPETMPGPVGVPSASASDTAAAPGVSTPSATASSAPAPATGSAPPVGATTAPMGSETTAPPMTSVTAPVPTESGMPTTPSTPGSDTPPPATSAATDPTAPEPSSTAPDAPDAGPSVPPPTNGVWPPPALKLTEVVTGATQPTSISAPRADATRLYFTEKWGIIRVIKDGVLLEEPALDMREAVLEGGPQGSTGDELMNQGKRGLVGLAFHPNYEENGRIFVMYTADQGIKGYGTVDHSNLYDDGDITFAEYKRSADNPDKFDPQPVAVFLQFDKGNCDQCSQHNGGSLEIDKDGFLWASTGDPPPYDNPGSADLNNLNGKLLRFDISGAEVVAAGNYPGADPYVASIGIRNGYKFSIDRYTGDIYVGDVGENSWEEITVEKYGEGHKDHGWPKVEGFQTYQAFDGCTAENCLDPVFDYGHTGEEGKPGADNCIIGGYVYRGQAIPTLQGTYIYGDNGSGKFRAIQVKDGELVADPHEFAGLSMGMGCFGEDSAGELYVCDYTNGKIMRFDAQ